MAVSLMVATKHGGYILKGDSGREKWELGGPFLSEEDINVINPDTKGNLFAATLTDGIFSSSNGGKSWEPRNRGLTVRKVWALREDVHNPGTLMAGTQYGHLFLSSDYGANWEEVTGLHSAPGRMEWGIDWGYGTTGLALHTILFDPFEKGRINILVSGNGGYYSRDGGKTWVRTLKGVGDSCPALQGMTGIPDGAGQSSQTVSEHLQGVHSCFHKMVLSQKRKGIMFHQNHCGVYMSGNGGESWKDISPDPSRRHGFPIALIEGSSDHLFTVPARQDLCKKHNTCIQGQLTVLKSSNHGKSWEEMSNGLPDEVHTGVLRDAMTSDSEDDSGLYIGTSTGEIYCSLDLGERWKGIAHGLGRIQGLTAF